MEEVSSKRRYIGGYENGDDLTFVTFEFFTFESVGRKIYTVPRPLLVILNIVI